MPNNFCLLAGPDLVPDQFNQRKSGFLVHFYFSEYKPRKLWKELQKKKQSCTESAKMYIVEEGWGIMATKNYQV